MKSRLYLNVRYFGFWIFYFVIARFIFLAVHYPQSGALDFSTLISIPIYGLKLDVSMAAYLSAIPFLLISFSSWTEKKIIKRIINAVTYPCILLMSILLCIDIGLYLPWGTRLDSSFLLYLNTPKEMLASLSTYELILGSVFWMGFSVIMVKVYDRVVFPSSLIIQKGKWWHMTILFFVFASLILPMRGGIQTIPINQSNVYFSSNMFANHAVVNYTWNFLKSATDGAHQTYNPYALLENKVAKDLVQESLSYSHAASTKVLKTERPNIIFIVWESLTAKIIKDLNGKPDVTPRFNELIKKGIFFDRFYANGARSDKGLVAIYSGYYPQPDRSIMKMPKKSRSLPMLPQLLKDEDYKTSFYYGGNMNFGNMNTYFRNGIDHFVDGDDFERSEWNSKWGAHDHILLQKFIDDHTGDIEEPFMSNIFTLSSHEPFEFPDTFKFGNQSNEDRFKSAHAYTDKSIGHLLDHLKQQSWWKNTLVIITADHGHTLPIEQHPHNGPRRFHVPMLWLGGALAVSDTIISTIGSQVDFPASLLDQMEVSHNFEWSKNLFASTQDHNAHYIFTKGYGTLNEHGEIVYDYNGKKVTHRKGDNTEELVRLGQSITQTVYQDFLNR